MQPLIITAAIVGAEVTRDQTPYLPITPGEIAEEAALCREKGASVIHLHVRDDRGWPTQDREYFRRAMDEIRSRTDVIIQVSTGGSVGMTPEERLQPVFLGPEMASLTTGSVNFGDDVFLNHPRDIDLFARTLKDQGVRPEVEVFDAGMIGSARRLVKKGLLAEPLHFNFVLGVPGGMPATAKNLLLLAESIPAGSTWTVSGIGRHQLSMNILGMVMGGHVRTGLEDNIFYGRGVLARGSWHLVDRLAGMAGEMERPVATPGEAREILGILPPDNLSRQNPESRRQNPE
ncbi:MAG: 3-keto-5-aminohexanoate cleavage protein [Bacillota bacterium]